ncbi:MAG: NAD-dependent DNA ligase LigA, partial [Lachnospiraceae bacterium]|nr:NAD-dependent DNA ligase LigA [Lachnospiraceae bacterium]
FSVWLSWKLDGATLVLTYDNGKLTKILTRGNGTIGTNITHLKNAIKGFPLEIAYKGHMVVRGEAVISYSDFAIINDFIENEDEKYANPRNLSAGSLNLDDVEEVKNRRIHFYAFTLVYVDENIDSWEGHTHFLEEMISWGNRMKFLEEMKFTVVEREQGTAEILPQMVKNWTKLVETGKMDLPVDGLVICYDDTKYALGGSVTGHHATRAGYAFKWQDESAETKLKYIEWSCAVSTISPVAVFEPVQLEGTTVSRASLCNLSEIQRLGIGKECTLEVIKANKIIPKCIAVKDAIGEVEIPKKCPICNADTQIHTSTSGTKTLHCSNPNCTAKNVKKFSRFVSKNGFDIDGLSIQTILKFMNEGFIREFADIYDLPNHFETICQMEGFGEKSCKNLGKAIEKSKDVHPINFIFALCIPMIGTDAAKKIINTIGFDEFLHRLRTKSGFEDIDGIGGEKSNSVLQWYENETNQTMLYHLLEKVFVQKVEVRQIEEGRCKGLVFVITGDVHEFQNRDALKRYVESQGGKVTGSVSKKTDYLINNDMESTSSKNKKAKDLGIPIISEDMFIEKFGK